MAKQPQSLVDQARAVPPIVQENHWWQRVRREQPEQFNEMMEIIRLQQNGELNFPGRDALRKWLNTKGIGIPSLSTFHEFCRMVIRGEIQKAE